MDLGCSDVIAKIGAKLLSFLKLLSKSPCHLQQSNRISTACADWFWPCNPLDEQMFRKLLPLDASMIFQSTDVTL